VADYLVLFLASARIGAIWRGPNPEHRPAAHRRILADCQPRLLFAFPARVAGTSARICGRSRKFIPASSEVAVAYKVPKRGDFFTLRRQILTDRAKAFDADQAPGSRRASYLLSRQQGRKDLGERPRR
jgi:acyl-coenzyme A synthetase/AMP-(fatty) acid ligase